MQFYSGLNAWRAGLLILGVIVHASGIYLQRPFLEHLDAVGFISHVFRMEAFFAISGFLAWRGSQKKGAAFALQRVAQLGLPLLTTLFLILPLGLYFARARFGYVNPGELGHLWFLVTLMFATICVDELASRTRILSVLAAIFTNRPTVAMVTVTAVASVFHLTGQVLSKLIESDIYMLEAHSFASALVRCPYFTVFYVLGFVIARSIQSSEIRNISPIWMVGPLALGVVLLGYFLIPEVMHGSERPIWIKALSSIIIPCVAVPMSFTVLKTGTEMKISNRVIAKIGECAFTVYLFHFSAVLASASYMERFDVSDLVKFLCTAFFSLAFPAAIHFGVIKKSRYALLLFNGRGLPSRKPPEGASGWESTVKASLS